MPPKPLIDVSQLDLSATVFDKEAIRRRIPQRFEMEMIDRVVHFSPAEQLIAGVKEVRDDEFWVRGHFPGRPILPGVLMVECAGQLSSFYFAEGQGGARTLAFGSAQEISFRGIVVPGDTLLMVTKVLAVKERSARSLSQGFVNGTLVFEGAIVGVVI